MPADPTTLSLLREARDFVDRWCGLAFDKKHDLLARIDAHLSASEDVRPKCDDCSRDAMREERSPDGGAWLRCCGKCCGADWETRALAGKEAGRGE